MRTWVASLIVLAVVLSSLPVANATRPVSTTAQEAALPQTTLTASAVAHTSAKLYWNQSGSSVFSGNGTHTLNSFTLTQPFNLTVAGSELVTQSSNSQNLGRLNVHQGSNALSNSTLSQVTVGPATSATMVNVSLATMTTSTGGALVSGHSYTDNVTTVSTIDLERNYGTTWVYTAPSYAIGFYNNASNGFWINSSVFVIPLPSIALNLSSIAVSVDTGASTAVGSYSLSGSNVIVSESPIAPSKTTEVVVTVRALTVGSAVPVPSVTLPAGALANYGSFIASAIYTDSGIPAYDGIYLVNFASGQEVDVQNVTLSINGAALKPSQFTAAEQTLTVLPGVFTVYEGQAVSFSATWYVPVGAPSASLAGYSTLVLPGISLGNAVGGVAMLFAVLAIVSIGLDRKLGNTPEQRFDELMDFGPGKRKASETTWSLAIVAGLLIALWLGLLLVA